MGLAMGTEGFGEGTQVDGIDLEMPKVPHD